MCSGGLSTPINIVSHQLRDLAEMMLLALDILPGPEVECDNVNTSEWEEQSTDTRAD